GLLGVVFVIGLLGYIVFKGFVIGIRCKDTFGSLLAIGISGMIGVQTAVNLGAITGWLPVTGVPLPFISYGGSSLILLMISVG
ncbi:FtsW/RodA/SpoVE family cell cycle protein, partial [Staphylococcus sp. SIMBA_130]